MSEITNFSVFDTAHKFQKEDFVNLSKTNFFELSIFLLYILGKLPEYNTTTNLMLMLTQNAFMRICEYFGGQTITIPKIEELESVLKIIQAYNYIDIQHLPYEGAVRELELGPNEILGYNKLKILLEECGVITDETAENSKTK